MRFLIHSNAPTTKTGYGVQTAHLARKLRDDGHDVAVSCTYGVQGGGRLWEGIQLYPAGYEAQSNDVIANHAMHWFGGDPKAGWIIVLTDVWGIVNPVLSEFNVIGWAPVDHFPVPPGVLQFFDRTGARCVAMSQFGADLFDAAGVDPTYIPLAVDASVYVPTSTVTINGQTVTGRELMGVDPDVFVVGMTAMNKDAGDRKGFNEAFRAFGAFHKTHPDSVLYVHSDPLGMGCGLNLKVLAQHAGIPPHALVFTDTYALFNGFSDQMMAAMYTAFDVLLAPSKGEGFCVPLIEAQACGTPVIVTDFSAQPELVGAGWKVTGQPSWDPAQTASYVTASVSSIVDALNDAYTADRVAMGRTARQFAQTFDVDRVWTERWRPYLATLEPEPLELDREPIPTSEGAVAVVVPVMRRPHNVAPLVASLSDPNVNLYFVCDPDDSAEIAAVRAAGLEPIISDRGHTFAQKVNCAYEATTEPWLFVCGDDVRFSPGWVNAARPLSDRFDVIGTNDAADGTGNKTVQAGKHADHFFIRRTYIDRYGASLDGPGVVCCEEYNHFFVDYEIVGLAKARGVFAPCLASIVEHLHPGLGKGQPDMVYQSMDSDRSKADRETWEARKPLIQMAAVR